MALAEGFSQHIGAWASSLGASQAAIRASVHAARHLALACATGDVCLTLSCIPAHPDWPSSAAAQQDLLSQSGLVGSTGHPGSHPLILDEDDRLYLHRYFDHERRLAQRLLRLQQHAPGRVFNDELIRQCLRQQFGSPESMPDHVPDWQVIAVAMSLTRGLTLVSGGPGTGKTTMLVKLLACLLQLDPECRIALAAPTGKAASRMSEALMARAEHLPAALRRRLPAGASTIHRLLGAQGVEGVFQHHAANPLPVDVLVVDEASMLDLALARRLLEALPDGARLVMLGDKEQLAAVEPGAVFSDLSASAALSDDCRMRLSDLTGIPAAAICPALDPTTSALSTQARSSSAEPHDQGHALRDCTVWFTRQFRFQRNSDIGQLAHHINSGDGSAVKHWLRAGPHPGVRWLDQHTAPNDVEFISAAIKAYGPYLDALAGASASPAELSQLFGSFRLLCAVREGPRGVEAINQAISQGLRNRLPGPPAGSLPGFYTGRPVLIRRNDHAHKLFNGDIGITLPNHDGQLLVHFPQTDGSFRAFAPSQLPAHDTAFAMSIHQSQGSEFDEVWVLLPNTENRVLTRELLYTAVTRARTRVTLIGSEAVIDASISSRTQRSSGLASRLNEAMQTTPHDRSG